MDKNIAIVVVVAFFSGLIVFLLRDTSRVSSITGAIGDATNSRPPVPSIGNLRKRTSSQGSTALPPSTGKTAIQSSLSEEDKVKGALTRLNGPLAFYGKAVDQNENPIAGVKIRFHVLRSSYVDPVSVGDETQRFDKETDGNGFVSVNGVSGYSLGIDSVEKKGYIVSPRLNTVPGGKGGPGDVMFIRLWKSAGSAALVHFAKNTRIPYDGTPVILDLSKEGKLVPQNTAGDLRVTLNRNPQTIRWGQKQPWDWEAKIEAINGGLLASEDEFMFQAPVTGYVPSISIGYSANDSKWRPEQKVSFYLKTGETYGRVTLIFITDSDKPTTGFNFNSYVNPTGSRNLE